MRPALEAYAIRPLRRSEYDRLVEEGAFEDERIELLDGLLIAREPQSPLHADIGDLLADLLRAQLGRRARVRTERPLALSETSEPEPDIAVVPPGRYRSAHPDRAYLIVEVAGSSLGKDRQLKAPQYAAAGIPEYWIVDLKARKVIVHRDPVARRWRSKRIYGSSATLSLVSFPDVRIELRELFAD